MRVNKALNHVGLRVARSSLAVDLRATTDDPLEAVFWAEGRPYVINVPIDHCRNLHSAAFSCSTNAGNPFISTLLEYRCGTCSRYGASPLRRYLDNWQPMNAAEALGLDSSEARSELVNSPALGCVLPWETRNPAQQALYVSSIIAADYRDHGFALDARHGWKVWGPISGPAGEAEFARLVRIYESIKSTGYKRSSGEDGDITGVALYRETEFRVIVGRGQHRIAALSSLAYRSVPVRIFPIPIHRSQVERWPNVRAGLFTVKQALGIFDRMFEARQPFTFKAF